MLKKVLSINVLISGTRAIFKCSRDSDEDAIQSVINLIAIANVQII